MRISKNLKRCLLAAIYPRQIVNYEIFKNLTLFFCFESSLKFKSGKMESAFFVGFISFLSLKKDTF